MHAPPSPPSPQGRGALLEELRRDIRARGSLPFSSFMARALYHPEHGYYSLGAGIGQEGGDFWTAPEIDPVFGELIGVQLSEMAKHVGEASFTIHEYGAGRASLAGALLDSWERQGHPLYRPGLYRILEISPALADIQRQRLAAHGPVVTVEEPGQATPFRRRPGVILMNEVLDALPVDRVRQEEDGLHEIQVGLDGDRLIEVSVPARPDLVHELERRLPPGMELACGQETELRPGLLPFLRQATSILDAGYLLIIDYGFEVSELMSPRRRRGTILAYHQHRAHDDLLSRVGQQDLTAHVDLTALAAVARACGFKEAGCTSQMRFLLALGLSQRIEDLEAAALDERQRTERRLAMTALIRPGGMGDIFKVWIGARGAPPNLAGLKDPFSRQASDL